MSKYNQLCRQINKNSAELRFNSEAYFRTGSNTVLPGPPRILQDLI